MAHCSLNIWHQTFKSYGVCTGVPDAYHFSRSADITKRGTTRVKHSNHLLWLVRCVVVGTTRYPSLIQPGFLYLGDWGDAEQQERLQELKIKR